nr:type II toxin-antitoxin system PemK/MazF family toxin [uncultured Rhodopila sp.]
MKRGDVVAVADRGGDFTGKPRPGVIVQSDLFAAMESVTICPLTSVPLDVPATRLRIEPSAELTLRTASWIAVDKITSVRRDRIGPPIGRLSPEDLQRLNGAIAVFLGLGG